MANQSLIPAGALTDQQREGARLAGLGFTGKQIAEELGVREETVSRWRRKPGFQAAVLAVADEAREAAVNRLNDLVGLALDTLEESITYQYDQRIRLTAAVKTLELAGVATLARARQSELVEAATKSAFTIEGDEDLED